MFQKIYLIKDIRHVFSISPADRQPHPRSLPMPLVRIDIKKHQDPTFAKRVGKLVYAAMHSAIDVPENDNFQILAEHDENHFIYDPTFMGINRTDGLVIIQITLMEGRTTEKKKTALQDYRREPQYRAGRASGRCIYQSGGGQARELVVRQWHRSVRRLNGLTSHRLGSTVMKQAAYIAFALLGLIWGTNFIFMKWAAAWITPTQIVFLRVLFGFLPILIFALVRRSLSWSHLRHSHHFLVMALLATVIYYYAFAKGTSLLLSSVAGMLSGAIPLFSFVTAWLFLRAEPLNRRTAFGIFLGFIGVILIARRGTAWRRGSMSVACCT
jgi:hypothetical protein